MPIPQRYRDQLLESHAAAEREAQHETRIDFARTVRDIVLWTVLGAALMGLAMSVSDESYGRVFWWLGHSVWFGGVTWSAVAAYHRGERRGDW